MDVKATHEIDKLNDCDALLISVASKDFKESISKFNYETYQGKFISCVKGFDKKSGKLMTEVLIDEFNIDSSKVFVLSGPNLSKELGNQELTGTVIAGEDEIFINALCNALKTDYFLPFSSNDRYGVELGGALKNIYAILSGYFHKKGVGENTIGLLLTKCLSEMSAYSKALGANPATFLGLAGVGDFFSTALSSDSRNYRFGEFLAEGLNTETALNEVGDTVEGYRASLLVHENAKVMNLDLKLLDYLISIYEGPKDLSEDKKIFHSLNIERDINF
jgi:glycerol-3-phosphate dehydrogenase (NAD(P)+)